MRMLLSESKYVRVRVCVRGCVRACVRRWMRVCVWPQKINRRKLGSKRTQC
eukprot:m.194239 g.194239  ORF g.194239 m.194239 type:complete len:51 (-) comp15447_c0_seq18:260-412(-)